jgi:hypothetical protein
MQQGSLPQVGDPTGHIDPTGSQQQQPLQSVQSTGSVALGWQTAAHAELSPPESVEPLDDPASVDPLELLLDDPASVDPPELLLDEPVLEEALLEAPLLEEPVLEELVLEDPPVEEPLPDELPLEDPLLEEEPPPLLLLLLQADSPTVDDAPATTSTWKSFSIFMARSVHLGERARNLPPGMIARVAPSEALRCPICRDRCPRRPFAHRKLRRPKRARVGKGPLRLRDIRGHFGAPTSLVGRTATL